MHVSHTLAKLSDAARRVRHGTRSALTAAQLGLFTEYVGTAANTSRVLVLGAGYGAWVIPQHVLSSASVCYCVGCGEDISFDLALIERFGCQVFGFDPTPRSIAFVTGATRDIANYHFFEIAVWDKTGTTEFFAPRDPNHVSHSITNLQGTTERITVPTKRLAEILRENGHARLSLLKLDVEGAEPVVLKTMLDDNLDVSVLLVEFDSLTRPSLHDLLELRSVIRRLREARYELFWIDGRNVTFVRSEGA
jgi:FkbM family methyltransferase